MKGKVIDFINRSLKEEPKTLLVLDCAPGFSHFEQQILEECYKLAAKGKVNVQEDYVTTLDSAHVEKCIQCLKDSQTSFRRSILVRLISYLTICRITSSG